MSDLNMTKEQEEELNKATKIDAIKDFIASLVISDLARGVIRPEPFAIEGAKVRHLDDTQKAMRIAGPPGSEHRALFLAVIAEMDNNWQAYNMMKPDA